MYVHVVMEVALELINTLLLLHTAAFKVISGSDETVCISGLHARMYIEFDTLSYHRMLGDVRG